MDNLSRLPKHVSLIMDGNGRWALQRGKERVDGHIEGVNSVREVMKTSLELGIEYISFFAFSEENWGRPQEEVNCLMELMLKALNNELKTFTDNGVRLLVLGNRERLPESLKESIDRVCSLTSDGPKMTMILFLSYSGKWDILQAAKKMAQELIKDPGRSFSEEDFGELLTTAGIPDPDLIIRTSGEERLSNYLLWQAAYSEFVFSSVLWPDFRRDEYLRALEEYSRRDRRFGKVK